ncbi:MAG: type II toxin-antitoxin system HicB family antitoxin [Synergistaceae bacterium]|nr:type II toxin-antitoxin system HicB family antitoxin [Synergistaceae bacterium]
MKDKYVFPAIFDYSDPVAIIISFPDLPGCYSEGDDNEHALSMARDALGGRLYILECNNEPIPEPSDILSIEHNKNQAVVLIDVFMPRIRDLVNNKAVNKTVTLPQWLISAGREEDINFSQTLQDALMEKLGIKREIKRRHYKKSA